MTLFILAQEGRCIHMPSVRFNVDHSISDEERIGIWNLLIGRLLTLPERIRDDVVMHQSVGVQYRGLNATIPHFAEVRVSMPDDEAELPQAIEDAILVANVLLWITDVEAYHPATGHFKFKAMGQNGFTML